MRYLFLILSCLLFVGIVYATNDAQITITKVDQQIFFDYTITTTENTLTIPVLDLQKVIYINANVDFNYTATDSNIQINLTESAKQNKFIAIKYRSSNLSANEVSLEKTVALDNIFDNTLVYFLDSDDTLLSAQPEYQKIDNRLSWTFAKGKPILIYFKFKSDVLDAKAIVSVIAGLIILGFIIYSVIRQKKARKKIDEKIEDYKIRLTENEQKIIELLKKQDGLMQQTIIEQLGLQKSHTSKLITKLERKNILERKQVGKINKIFLKK